jgi:hypothetical protein
MDATRFVMDYLRHGFAGLESMLDEGARRYQLTPDQLLDACDSLGVECVEGRGRRWVRLPVNLKAIWWSNRPHAGRFYGSAA